MVTVDTNVLVRALVEDLQTPEQSQRARAVLARAHSSGDQVYVPDIVVVETVWVLRKVLKAGKEEIVALLRGLIENALYTFDDVLLLWRALHVWEAQPGDLADLLIGERAAARGALPVYTFDEDLHEDPRYEPPR